jgi:hypothetical protein
MKTGQTENSAFIKMQKVNTEKYKLLKMEHCDV